VILSAVAPCDESDSNPTTPKTNILPHLFVAVPEPAGRPVGTTTVLVDAERGVAGTFGPRFKLLTLGIGVLGVGADARVDRKFARARGVDCIQIQEAI